MTRTLITFTFVGAAALSVGATPQSGAVRPGQGSATTAPQGQTSTISPGADRSTAQVPRAGESVTFTGCVRQASDQATLFALYSMPGHMNRTTPGVAPSDAAGSTARSATQATTSAVPSAPANPTAGTWYRLTPASNAQDLKEYVGKTVRVTGVYTPSTRGSTGTENHSTTQFTAGDVSHSPLIAIQSITPVATVCTAGTSN